jgi:hypothetical protein
MRGIFHIDVADQADQDSFPGDGLSAVFGGGVGNGFSWTQGMNSVFLVQPSLPLNPGGQCLSSLASTSHRTMQAALADGSVRSISDTITPKTWAAVLTPSKGDIIGPDWLQ